MDTYFPIKIQITEGKNKGQIMIVNHNELPIGTAFKVLQTNVAK